MTLVGLVFFVNCSTTSTEPTVASPTCLEKLAEGGTNSEWSAETLIQLTGYTGNAMEPQIVADGLVIFFNDKLPGDSDMSIHYAVKTSDAVYAYAGKFSGSDVVNVMDGVAAIDSNNRFYFMSLRDYGVGSRYRSLFKGDIAVSGTSLILNNVGHADANLSNGQAPSGNRVFIDMDLGVSWDGTKAVVASTEFVTGQGYPNKSWLNLYDIDSVTRQFSLNSSSETIFANVNVDECKIYAPTLSNDMTELYYTALQYNGSGTPEFRILVAKRNSVSDAFGKGAIIQAISGSGVEGPSISLDDGGKTLYYHKLDTDGVFRLYRVTRP